MRWSAALALLLCAQMVSAEEPANSPFQTILPEAVLSPTTNLAEHSPYAGLPLDGGRGLFESDRAFPRFVGPISNPVLTKDPRSLTEIRFLFVDDWIPSQNAVLGGGDFQVYGAQVRVALTDRLTFIADKDGFAQISPHNLPARSGWLDIAAGLKYALVRDVENQFLVTAGFMYEPPTGEAKVFQHVGDGAMTVFGVVGKEFAEYYHVLLNGGYQFGINDEYNSSFFYSQLHLDRQFFGWLSPLVELNWFYYTDGGNHGIPQALGEGDGLINFGTTGVAGHNIVTAAAGFKAQLNCHMELGAAWETPLGRKDLIGQRLLVELILRY